MKLANLSKVIGASVLSLSLLGALPHSASAQTDTTAPGTTQTTPNTTTTRVVEENDGFDWGWLGLLGLLGLAGLARKREEPARYREPDEVARPGSTRY